MRRTYMPKRTQGKKVVKKCKECLLIDMNYQTCTVFLDPEYQYRNGKQCWGRCDSSADMIKRLKAMYDYSLGEDKFIAQELAQWRLKEKDGKFHGE